MPISQRQFYRRTTALLAAGLAILVLIVSASLYLSSRTSANFERVVATRQVRSAAADLMLRVTEAETGQRGFLLTRDEPYLEPYRRAVGQVPALFARLEEAIARLTGAPASLDLLRGQIDAKLSEMAATVAEAQSGDFEQALATMRAGEGRRLMDGVRASLDAMLDTAETALQAGIQEQESVSTALMRITLLGAMAILLMAMAAAWTILRYTREIAAARSEVEAANSALEARVNERTQELMKANEEIQRFAYIVTHDLRAPLVNIMGFTSELEETFQPIRDYMDKLPVDDPALKARAREALDDEVPEALGFIRSSTRKMDGLINAILKISRDGRRTLKPERIDLEQVLEAAAAAVHHQASEDGGAIEVESSAGSIVSDRFSLDQILGNLLDNAIKYRAKGRPVQIVARARRDAIGRVVIEVEDNGRGIAEADHERVFELFRRSGQQNTQGEGIGLAHVRTLARNLGGDITVRSELGRGSTFVIHLPADLNAVKRSNPQ